MPNPTDAIRTLELALRTEWTKQRQGGFVSDQLFAARIDEATGYTAMAEALRDLVGISTPPMREEWANEEGYQEAIRIYHAARAALEIVYGVKP